MSHDLNDDFKISFVFRDRIIELASESELKKEELAKKIGVSKDIWLRAVNLGIIPGTRSLIKIADYFEVPIEYLLDLIDNDYFVKSENLHTFQDRLTALKKRDNTTSCQVATSIGISRSLFNFWKRFDYLPSVEVVFALSRHFDVSMDYLLARTDVEKFNK